MEKLILGIVVSFFVAIFLILIHYFHTPRCVLNDDDKKRITSYGLFHYTEEAKAFMIISNGLRNDNKKSLIKSEKDLVWLYIADPEEIVDKCKIVNSKTNRDTYDTIVLFKNVTDEQMDNLRIRRTPKLLKRFFEIFKFKYNDEAVVYKGVFDASNAEIVKYEDINRLSKV